MREGRRKRREKEEKGEGREERREKKERTTRGGKEDVRLQDEEEEANWKGGKQEG